MTSGVPHAGGGEAERDALQRGGGSCLESQNHDATSPPSKDQRSNPWNLTVKQCPGLLAAMKPDKLQFVFHFRDAFRR